MALASSADAVVLEAPFYGSEDVLLAAAALLAPAASTALTARRRSGKLLRSSKPPKLVLAGEAKDLYLDRRAGAACGLLAARARYGDLRPPSAVLGWFWQGVGERSSKEGFGYGIVARTCFRWCLSGAWRAGLYSRGCACYERRREASDAVDAVRFGRQLLQRAYSRKTAQITPRRPGLPRELVTRRVPPPGVLRVCARCWIRPPQQCQ